MRFRTGLILLAAVVVLGYWPVLIGYVPFPADVVLFFPPWEAVSKACCAAMQHAELGDLVTQFYPWRTTLNSTLSFAHAPLWNFHYLMGAPYQAMPQSAVFFPLNWLFAILSGPLAWALLFPIRAVFLAVTTAIFVRRLGASTPAALISGFTFAFCGWVVAFQGRPQLDSAMWLPLMFLSIDLLRQRPSPSSIALGGLAFALPIFGGHPEVAFQVILLALLYAAYRLFPLTPAALRYLAAFAGAGLLSILLSAVQLLPTLEWIGLIPRSLAQRWELPPGIHPLAFLSRDLFHQPNADHIFIPEGAAYLGAVALAALPFSWLSKRRGDALFFGLLGLVSMAVAFHWQPVHDLVNQIPVLAGLPNWRFLGGTDFAFAVLAGLALSALQARSAETATPARPAGILVALLVSAAACCLLALRLTGHTAIPYYADLLLILLALMIFALANLRSLQPAAFVRWTCVLVAADLLASAFGYVPYVRPAAIYPRNPVFEFLQRQAGSTWRVGSVDQVYGRNFEVPYRLSTAIGYDFPTTRAANFLEVFSNNPDPLVLSFDSDRLLSAPRGALDLTGTRYFVGTTWNTSSRKLSTLPEFHQVFDNGSSQVFENPSAVPLASFLPKSAIRVIAADNAQWKVVAAPDFDPRRTVVVPADIGRFPGTPGSAPALSIDPVAQSPGELRIPLAADQEGLLLLDEAYYPGWVADVDGMDAPVIRADYTFMAVPVAPGPHTVRFRFAPRPERTGGLLSGLACVLIAGMFAFGRLARSPEKPSPPGIETARLVKIPARVLTPILVIGALLLGIQLGRRRDSSPAADSAASRLSIPPGQAAVGFLDKVDNQPVVSVLPGGQVHLSGWAACADPASPLSRLEVLVDNQPVAEAALAARLRPDVAAAYTRPDFNNSGWKADFSAQSIAPGSHPLSARAVCANGESSTLPAFQLVVR